MTATDDFRLRLTVQSRCRDAGNASRAVSVGISPTEVACYSGCSLSNTAREEARCRMLVVQNRFARACFAA